MATKTALAKKLDATQRNSDAKNFEAAMYRKVVGQEDAVDKVTAMYSVFLAKLNAPGRPLGNFLFLGPTGTGKTRTVEAAAEALFGSSRAMLKVDCSEFQGDQEICKLIGSPPGYLGHKETHPYFTQEAIDQWQTSSLQLTLVLFDEIEKANDALWTLLLGIMDKGTLTLGTNEQVDMSRCVIFLTSNLGAEEIQGLISGGVGFRAKAEPLLDADLDEKMERVAKAAAKKTFTPEFINRIDSIVTFKTLRDEHIRKILDIELEMLQQRILVAEGGTQFVFKCTPAMKDFLFTEGRDPKYGARHLKRAIELNLMRPFANLVGSKQIDPGDLISVDRVEGEITFEKEATGVLLPALVAREWATIPPMGPQFSPGGLYIAGLVDRSPAFPEPGRPKKKDKGSKDCRCTEDGTCPHKPPLSTKDWDDPC